MSTLETTVTIEATLPRSSASGTKPSRLTARTEPSPGEIDGESLPNVAKRLDNFSILRKLGSGAMGVVYAAYDENLGRRVAIKLLRQQLARQTPRFVREAQGLARLQHPNVVSIHHIGTHESRMFIVMEFVAGRTLRKWLELGPHSREAILHVFKQAARGLAAAHEANLVHRDFKPDNVMVGDDGRVRVMDFGLVHEDGGGLEELLSSDGSSHEELELAQRRLDSALNLELTQPGALLGTPAYMAPEQHLSQPTDARADQFAFCVALWEALYGRRPFKGGSWQELIENVTSRNIQEPRRGSNIPNWLRTVIERGLATEPCERWDSMNELVAALEADPTQRRRGIIGGSIALVISMAGALGYQAHLDNQRDTIAAAALAAEQELDSRCTAEGSQIREVWSTDLRERVSTAMRGVDHPIAEDAWQRTENLFNDYSASWAQTRRQVCMDASHDPERAQWAALARSCLDQRAQSLRSLAQVFTKFNDGNEILAALSSTASLPSVAECTDEDILERTVLLPEPELAEQVDAARRLLSDAAANSSMGRYKTARRQAASAVVESERIGWKPLIAAALMWRGSSDLALRNFEAAEHDLESALFLAGEDFDPLSINAAASLASIAGDQARWDEALRWGQVGKLLVHNNDAQGSLFHAKLLSDLGSVHGKRGAPDEAIASLEQALEIYEQRLPAGHPTQATTLNNLAVVYQELGRNTQALDYHSRALELRERNLPPTHPDIAYSKFGIGRVYFQRAEFDLATAAFSRALEIWETNYGADYPLISYPLTELGRSLEASGQLVAARAPLERALQLRAAGPSAEKTKELHETRFILARVLWAQSELEPATKLALAAWTGYADIGDEAHQTEVGAWLEQHQVELPARN